MTNSSDSRPSEVRKAMLYRDETLFLRMAGMPLPPWADALILIGNEQQRRWEQGETLLKKEESNFIKAYYDGKPLPPESGAFIEVANKNVKRWKDGLPPLSIDEQRKIVSGYIDEPMR